MNKEGLKYVLPVVTLVLGTLLGSGAIWNWKNSQIELSRLQMESAKTSIELRDKKNELLIDIIMYNSNSAKRKANYTLYRSIIDDFNMIEKNLAVLEEREAKTVDFEKLLPSPPTKLNLQ